MEELINLLKQIFQNINNFFNSKLLLLEEKENVKNLIARVNMSESDVSIMNKLCIYLADFILIIIAICLICKLIKCIYRLFSRILNSSQKQEDNGRYVYNNKKNNRRSKRKRQKGQQKAKRKRVRNKRKHIGLSSFFKGHRRNSSQHYIHTNNNCYDVKRIKSHETDAYDTMEIPIIKRNDFESHERIYAPNITRPKSDQMDNQRRSNGHYNVNSSHMQSQKQNTTVFRKTYCSNETKIFSINSSDIDETYEDTRDDSKK